MKKITLFIPLIFLATLCFGQKGAISYEDIKFILRNNLMQDDTFLNIKGYVTVKKDNDTKNRQYTISGLSDTYTKLNLRLDGKRMYIELETNQPGQFALIHDSIVQFLDKNAGTPGIQTYVVKDLGTIYVTSEEAPDGNPLKRDYDIQIAGDKHITINN
jgi:uncharacterized protein (DUF342 family)